MWPCSVPACAHSHVRLCMSLNSRPTNFTFLFFTSYYVSVCKFSPSWWGKMAIAFRQSKHVGQKRSEQIHYRSQSVTWSGNLGLVHANRGTMPPQFKSNKRPGELVWISEHVLSFTERTAPSRTPFMKKRKGKKGGETCRPSLLNSALSIWCGRQIGYGKLLNPSSLSPPFTGSGLYGSCRSRALGLCSCENQSRWGTRNELRISGNFKPKLPVRAGFTPTAGVASGHVDFGIIIKKPLLKWVHLETFLFSFLFLWPLRI